MEVEHHELSREFPEYRERIPALKSSNPGFARLCDEFQAATLEVERLEEAGVPVADETFEELKKKRLHLMDAIYDMLKRSA